MTRRLRGLSSAGGRPVNGCLSLPDHQMGEFSPTGHWQKRSMPQPVLPQSMTSSDRRQSAHDPLWRCLRDRVSAFASEGRTPFACRRPTWQPSAMAREKTEVWNQLATRIPKELHRRLKLYCVTHDMALMHFVTEAIEGKLGRKAGSKKGPA